MWRGNMPDSFNEQDWLSLAPELTIGGDVKVEDIALSNFELKTIAETFWAEGYMQFPRIFQESSIKPVREAMQTLHDQAIPPVYIYVYDQPWQLFARLSCLLHYFLGNNFAVLPNLWAWHLAKEGDSGWSMHRDCDAQTVFDVNGDKLLMSLSLWLPLTDATENNGCMSVRLRNGEAARALPVKAGSLLGWAQDLYHWGGAYTDQAENPRLSLSLEFQNTAFHPLAEPLLTFSQLPSFSERHALIAEQFGKYRHIESGIGKGA